MVVSPAQRVTDKSEIVPRANPKVSEPESPMKIVAGYEL